MGFTKFFQQYLGLTAPLADLLNFCSPKLLDQLSQGWQNRQT